MKGLFTLAAEVQQFLEEQSWQYCFIGGLALQRWGENRLTQDVDLVILAGFGREEVFIDSLLNRFSARQPDAREFALKHRVLLLESSNKIGIDISLAAMPFEEEFIKRASKFEFISGISIKTCSAEDLVVLKAFANRPQDWVDIRGILLKQMDDISRSKIWTNLAPLVELKEEPEILDKIDLLWSEVFE